jgi:hypothetical protein
MTEEQEKQESQKTLVAFVAGLLIGGLLVWVFGGTPETKDGEMSDDAQVESSEEMSDDATDTETGVESSASVIEAVTETVTTPTMEVGEGEIEVSDQAAGLLVNLDSATFPTSEGWIGVRTFPNGQIGSILGAARYSEEQGLIPTEVELLAPTVAGRTYAVVFFTEDGDRKFDPAYDVQIDSVLTTFTAQ